MKIGKNNRLFTETNKKLCHTNRENIEDDGGASWREGFKELDLTNLLQLQ